MSAAASGDLAIQMLMRNAQAFRDDASRSITMRKWVYLGNFFMLDEEIQRHKLIDPSFGGSRSYSAVAD